MPNKGNKLSLSMAHKARYFIKNYTIDKICVFYLTPHKITITH